MLRRKVMGWLFSGVFALVVSLPFMLPGCSPMPNEDAGSIDRLVTGAIGSPVDSFVQLANDEATAESRATTLDDVIAQTGGAVDAGGVAPVFTRQGDHLVATTNLGGLTVTCTIRIVDQRAQSTCGNMLE